MTKTLTKQNQGGRPRSYSPALVHQIVSEMLKKGRPIGAIDAAAVKEVLCEDHDVSQQIRMESLKALVDTTLIEIEEADQRTLVEQLPQAASEAIATAMANAQRDLTLLVARQNAACQARASQECEELRADKRNANWRIAELESLNAQLEDEKHSLIKERDARGADVSRLGTELADALAEIQRLRGEDGTIQLLIAQLQKPTVREELRAAFAEISGSEL